jgi:hypothetical protein
VVDTIFDNDTNSIILQTQSIRSNISNLPAPIRLTTIPYHNPRYLGALYYYFPT